MKRRTITRLLVYVSIAATCGGAHIAWGQPESRPPNNEHLKPMESFIGEWIAETVTEEELPEIAPKGTPVVVPVSYQWILNKTFISVEYSVKAGDETVLSYKGYIGWDPATEQFKSWGFDSDGGHGQAIWTRGDSVWTAKVSGVQQDGKQVSATMTRVDTGEDSFTVQFRDQSVDGQPQSDGPELRFHRRASVAGETAVEEVQVDLAVESTANTQESGLEDDLLRVQGTWERWEGVVFRKRRITKQVDGNSEKVTYYNRDGSVQSAHTVDFRLKRGPGPVRNLQFYNQSFIAGPNQGEKNEGEMSYVYKVGDDSFVEVWGMLVGDETQPINTLRWQRVAE